MPRSPSRRPTTPRAARPPVPSHSTDDSINTEGWGWGKPSWTDGYYWWAWSPTGLITGSAESEADAKAQAQAAVEPMKMRPKGHG